MASQRGVYRYQSAPEFALSIEANVRMGDQIKTRKLTGFVLAWGEMPDLLSIFYTVSIRAFISTHTGPHEASRAIYTAVHGAYNTH